MTVRTWVGRFCTADGRVEEEGPWLGSLIRQRPDEDPDELYVLVEPASPRSEEYTSQLVDVVTQLYNKDPLSLTGALTRSMRAAHEHLREWNRRSLPEHQVGAGSTCLALRGHDAYLAQIGPSVAYVRTAAGDLRRIAPDDPSSHHALGVADEFEPRLTRINLRPGDLVLIASSQLEAIASPEHIGLALARGADEALPEFYLLCRDRPNMALVLLSCFEEETISPPDFMRRDGAGDGAAPEAATAAASEITAPVTAAAAAQPVQAAAASSSSPASATLAASTGGDAALPLAAQPAHERVREITQSTAPPPATGVRLRGDSATPRYKRTTGPVAIPQFRISRLVVFGVIALALLGLIAYWQLPAGVAQSREDKFTAAVATARDANARAQATSDGGLKRRLLGDARGSLTEAAKIHKDNADVASLQRDVASAMAVLDAVLEIKDFTPISDLAQQVTGSLSVTRAVIGGDDAYLLDAKGHRVLRVALAGGVAPETILQNGEAAFITPSRPVQITWSESTSSLTIIDEKRQAFAYFPQAHHTLPLTVRGADGIGSVDAIAGSGGNLYVLDVKQNQVWRYLPGQGGFDSERTALLDSADLRDASELAVGEDVYVLDSKRGIRRFRGKAEDTFPLAGIDTPLMSAGSISVLPGTNRIVVADRGNKRIVVASADGKFIRQIVSPAFTDLRSVAVDEGKSILYVLNGDTLLRAPFPP